MQTWTKISCAAAILVLAVSAGLSAQPADRGREAPGGDTRERPADRPDAGSLPDRAQEAVETGVDAAAGAVERAHRGVARRMEAFERQMERFEQIHARRTAQLQRLRDLAIENGREDVLERVNKLVERESERYANQIRRLQERIERTASTPDGEQEDEAGSEE